MIVSNTLTQHGVVAELSSAVCYSWLCVCSRACFQCVCPVRLGGAVPGAAAVPAALPVTTSAESVAVLLDSPATAVNNVSRTPPTVPLVLTSNQYLYDLKVF